jgi:hypothetical protein
MLNGVAASLLCGCLLQAFTSRPARGLITQVTKDLQDVQCQLPMSMIGLVCFAAGADMLLCMHQLVEHCAGPHCSSSFCICPHLH